MIKGLAITPSILVRISIGKSMIQGYRIPMYYVDLTLREGIHLQETI